jgi:Uma2 family endonuclease
MATVIRDPFVESELRHQRAESGQDRYDEVWNGVHVISPLADVEHQEIVSGLVGVFYAAITAARRGVVLAGVIVSDRVEGWSHNYRIPDVAVYLKGTTARQCHTHWAGGPDFAVEITSGEDPEPVERDKLPFYGTAGTRELLLVDRTADWSLELYRLEGAELLRVARHTTGDGSAIESSVLPYRFRLVPAGTGRPAIEVAPTDAGGEPPRRV